MAADTADQLTDEQRLELASRRGDGEELSIEEYLEEKGLTTPEESEEGPEHGEIVEVGTEDLGRKESGEERSGPSNRFEGTPYPIAHPEDPAVSSLYKRKGPWRCKCCGGESYLPYRCNAIIGHKEDDTPILCGSGLDGAGGTVGGESATGSTT